MANSRFEDFLQFAIEQEREAARLYEQNAVQVQSRSARELLLQMAAMERAHQQLLEEVARRGTAAFPLLGEISDMQLAHFVVDFKLTPQSSLEEVFLFAIKAEQKAATLYARLAQLELDEDTRALFERLVREEQGHKNQLEAEFEQAFMSEN
jgi:rubrerythrin